MAEHQSEDISESAPPAQELEQPDEQKEEMPPGTLWRNFICCVLMDAGWVMGWTCVAVGLQPLLKYLGASPKIIGYALGTTFASLPGIILTPFITRRFPYKKWYFFVANIPYLLPLGIIGLMVILAPGLGISSGSLITLVLVLMLAHWFFGGFLALPHQEFVVACVPSTHRARYVGLLVAMGAVLGVAMTYVGEYVLKYVSKPLSYGYLFLIGWAIMQGGYILVVPTRETRTPVEKSPCPGRKLCSRPSGIIGTMSSVYLLTF